MKIDVSTKGHPNTFAEIDDEDYDRIAAYRWTATRRRNKLYVRGRVEGRDVLLHRFIMGEPDGMVVDHRDGNPLNNRRSVNLRICTIAQNNKFADENGAFDHLKKGGVHTVKRKLADGSIRIHRYDRRTRERLANEEA